MMISTCQLLVFLLSILFILNDSYRINNNNNYHCFFNKYSLSSIKSSSFIQQRRHLFELQTATITIDNQVDYLPEDEDTTGSSSTLPENIFQLNELRKSMPNEIFEKSLFKSLSYMFFDYLIIGISFGLFYSLVKSPLWTATTVAASVASSISVGGGFFMPLWLKALSTILYANITGFFMWSIFVVGHDCGHTTFSNNKMLNDIIGHITHGSILVPFYPWQLSHRRHHMFHNHIEKDYSYQWITPDKEKKLFKERPEVIPILKNKFLMAIIPFFGWPFYLLGFDDGSHFIPFKNARLWRNTPNVERIKCLVSSAVVLGFGSLYYLLAGKSLSTLALFFGGPYMMFGWWLVAVTYLQHHGPKTVVYDNHDWKYVNAAFETVDRSFGKIIDKLHHHITSDHVIHHVFFTQIPHYHLSKATLALKKYLKEKNLEHIYRYEETYDFPIRVHKYFFENGFKAIRASALPIVTAASAPSSTTTPDIAST